MKKLYLLLMALLVSIGAVSAADIGNVNNWYIKLLDKNGNAIANPEEVHPDATTHIATFYNVSLPNAGFQVKAWDGNKQHDEYYNNCDNGNLTLGNWYSVNNSWGSALNINGWSSTDKYNVHLNCENAQVMVEKVIVVTERFPDQLYVRGSYKGWDTLNNETKMTFNSTKNSDGYYEYTIKFDEFNGEFKIDDGTWGAYQFGTNETFKVGEKLKTDANNNVKLGDKTYKNVTITLYYSAVGDQCYIKFEGTETESKTDYTKWYMTLMDGSGSWIKDDKTYADQDGLIRIENIALGTKNFQAVVNNTITDTYYNHTTNGAALVNEQWAAVNNVYNNSLSINGAKDGDIYTIEFDCTKTQVRVVRTTEGKEPEPEPETTYLYVVGNGNIGETALGWDLAKAYKLEGKDGVYTFTATDLESFKISTSNKDWDAEDGFNKYGFCIDARENSEVSESDLETELKLYWGSGQDFVLPSVGEYEVVVKVAGNKGESNSTITITRIGDAPNVSYTLYGNIFGTDDNWTETAMTRNDQGLWVAENVTTFIGNFGIRKYVDDEQKEWITAKKGTNSTVNIDKAIGCVSGDENNFYIAGSNVYTYTFDPKAMTLLVTLGEQDVYILGNISHTDAMLPHEGIRGERIQLDGSDDEVYQFRVTVAIDDDSNPYGYGYFEFADRLAKNWDELEQNAIRYGADGTEKDENGDTRINVGETKAVKAYSGDESKGLPSWEIEGGNYVILFNKTKMEITIVKEFLPEHFYVRGENIGEGDGWGIDEGIKLIPAFEYNVETDDVKNVEKSKNGYVYYGNFDELDGEFKLAFNEWALSYGGEVSYVHNNIKDLRQYGSNMKADKLEKITLIFYYNPKGISKMVAVHVPDAVNVMKYGTEDEFKTKAVGEEDKELQSVFQFALTGDNSKPSAQGLYTYEGSISNLAGNFRLEGANGDGVGHAGTSTVQANGTYEDAKLSDNTALYNTGVNVLDGGKMTFVYNPDNTQASILSVSDTTVGVIDIAVDGNNGEAIYYNLQGVRVVNPENGIFIRVQGNEAVKVIK